MTHEMCGELEVMYFLCVDVRRKPELVRIDNFKAGFFTFDKFVTSCKEG